MQIRTVHQTSDNGWNKVLTLPSVDKMIKKGKPYNKMMKEFDERLKRIFKDTADQEIMDCEVPGLPDDAVKRVEDGFVEIDRGEMQDIFEPVVQEILRLVQEQVDLVQLNGSTRVSVSIYSPIF